MMKHMAIDPKTQKLVNPSDATRTFKHKYVPRIRCLDCPGRIYLTGPGKTAESFESHLKNRLHRSNVEERLEQEGS